MTAEEYLRKVNKQVQDLFDLSLKENEETINLGINTSMSLQTWLGVIPDEPYKILLSNSIQALELSLLSQGYCLYRNSFSALRLSMEMLFGGIYFSTNLIDFIEWTKSSKDLNWSTINDYNNGILSHRFYKAFFPEIKSDCESYYTRAKDLYRDLSEYVHGNHHTWITDSKALKVEKREVDLFKRCLSSYKEIAIFSLCLRYIKGLNKENLEKIEPIIMENLNHIVSIHSYLTI
ncbi:hypothetical protein [Chitinophaga sp. Cy-1792]|uniref:hypothetical protein n=1 Tax=Chitinophaga sp. Cy-1792 TaxID=2608339 RepID=UPI00141F090C|nr:hypothetical protein [Chitinophaga sp. Cy-1792]NIG56963.1 hypothetical protein [Chitinophaga sp. Cy-1792]